MRRERKGGVTEKGKGREGGEGKGGRRGKGKEGRERNQLFCHHYRPSQRRIHVLGETFELLKTDTVATVRFSKT